MNAMSGTILLAGFEKWGPYSTNPAAEIATALDGERIEGYSIVGEVLPINFQSFRGQIKELIESVSPDIAYGIGMDFKDSELLHVELEARAIAQFGEFLDNEGMQAGTVELDNNPEVLELPGREHLAQLVKESGLPIAVSTDAGQHMCETVLRDLLSLSDRGRAFDPGFIHVPHLPDQLAESVAFQAHRCSMPLEQQLKIVRGFLEIVVRDREAGEERLHNPLEL